MKRFGILTTLLTTLLILTACRDNESYPQLPDETEPSVLEATESIEPTEPEENTSAIPEVSDEDLVGIPEDALVIPLTDLHEHELSAVFENDEWMLCHLTGDCTQSVWGQVAVNGDLLTFGVPDRVATPTTEDYIYSCVTNERNNLLICEILAENFGGGGEFFVGADSSVQLPEMTVRITETTTFEIWHTDGHQTDKSEGTKTDLTELLENGRTSFNLNIVHKEINGDVVATHILMMIFPWR